MWRPPGVWVDGKTGRIKGNIRILLGQDFILSIQSSIVSGTSGAAGPGVLGFTVGSFGFGLPAPGAFGTVGLTPG